MSGQYPDGCEEEGVLSGEQLQATLSEYLHLEDKFQPRLYLPNTAQHGEVCVGARDGAAHVLRCLRMWYELPVDVAHHATNLLDRFLTKMKVRPCHMPCITVSCMNIAIEDAAPSTSTVSIEELVRLSQSTCTAGDVRRMSNVIRDKLGCVPDAPVLTPLHWLRLLLALGGWVGAPPALLQRAADLEARLTVLLCDYQTVNYRAPELALVLIYGALEEISSGGACEAHERVSCALQEVRVLARVSAERLASCGECVQAALAAGAQSRGAARQRLIWRLSSRTLKVLRPTERLTSLLPTIQEANLPAPSADHDAPSRYRSGSESSVEGEESADWPRSPILPVYTSQ